MMYIFVKSNHLSLLDRPLQGIMLMRSSYLLPPTVCCLYTHILRHVFKESAEQRVLLNVFLEQPLPNFRQPLLRPGSLFNRHCHRCRSREDGGGSCKQHVVICWKHVIHALLQINYVDCWRIWMITGYHVRFNVNVRILYQLKHTGGSLQYGNHHGNCSTAAVVAYCVFNATSAAGSL